MSGKCKKKLRGCLYLLGSLKFNEVSDVLDCADFTSALFFLVVPHPFSSFYPHPFPTPWFHALEYQSCSGYPFSGLRCADSVALFPFPLLCFVYFRRRLVCFGGRKSGAVPSGSFFLSPWGECSPSWRA